MPVGLLKDIMHSRPHGVLMGLDVGEKTLGLALSDPAQTMAVPFQTIKRVKFRADMKALMPLVRAYEVRGFVVGLALSMDGHHGPRAQSTTDFALSLAAFWVEEGWADPWVALQDERLSTMAVAEATPRRAAKAKIRGHTDALAAQVILQSALDTFS